MTAIEFHPIANAYPLFDEGQLADLTEDIRQNGQKLPIWLFDGQIIDGRNRYLACEKAGITPRLADVPEGTNPFAFSLSMNHHRRDLSAERRYLIWCSHSKAAEVWDAEQQRIHEEANAKRSDAAKAQPRTEDGTRLAAKSGASTTSGRSRPRGKGSAAKARASGTNRGAVERMEQLLKARPDLARKVKDGEISPSAAIRQMKKDKRRQEDADRAASLPSVGDRWRVAHGDLRSALCEPVDAIITDPPYPLEYLPLFEALAERAVEWLKPGGVLAVMSGQAHLPEVYKRLTGSLTYRWTFAYLTPGGQAVQIFPRRINTFWKPVLVYTNGDPAASEWAGDVATSKVNDNDKAHHDWGQSVSGMTDLIGRLTRVGDTILDPFMGAGTTGIAAILSGRRFVGFDVDEEHVRRAVSRLHEVSNAAVA